MPTEKFIVLWTEVAEFDLNSIIDYVSKDSVDRALEIFERIKNNSNTLKTHPIEEDSFLS